MLPGPDRLTVKKGDGGYVIEFDYRPNGRKTPERVTKIATDEFELRGTLKEVYG
jgi:hypothetical protein